MNINELESQIAFQIKPIIQTQQQTIEFYKSRYQKFSCYSETQNLKKSDSKHIRTKSLNTTKFNRHQEFLQKTEKMKVYLPEVNTINSQKMEKYVDLIKATVNNLNFEIISYKKNKETGIKDNKSYKLKKKKH